MNVHKEGVIVKTGHVVPSLRYEMMTIDQSEASTHLVAPLIGHQHAVLVPVIIGLGLRPVKILRLLPTLNPDPGP